MIHAVPILGLNSDILCDIFAGRILLGRSVCKTLKTALEKAGSSSKPLILRVLHPPDDWGFLRQFSHARILVSADADMLECIKHSIRAEREVGYADVDNAIELDFLRPRPTNKHIWAVANTVAQSDDMLPHISVLKKLVEALSFCQHVRGSVHCWLTLRLLTFVHRPDIFALGLQLYRVYNREHTYSSMILQEISSEAAVTATVSHYKTAPGLYAAQTLLDLVQHSSLINLSYEALVHTGCLQTVLDMADNKRHGDDFGRYLRHLAILALGKLIQHCDDMRTIQALLDARIVQIMQLVSCSDDYYFSIPSCLAMYEMATVRPMCAAMIEANMHEILASLCKNGVPHAVLIMSALLNGAMVMTDPPNLNASFMRMFCVYNETVRWLEDNSGFIQAHV